MNSLKWFLISFFIFLFTTASTLGQALPKKEASQIVEKLQAAATAKKLFIYSYEKNSYLASYRTYSEIQVSIADSEKIDFLSSPGSGSKTLFTGKLVDGKRMLVKQSYFRAEGVEDLSENDIESFSGEFTSLGNIVVKTYPKHDDFKIYLRKGTVGFFLDGDKGSVFVIAIEP